MNKLFHLATPLLLTTLLSGCMSDKLVVVHDSCQVLDKTLYSDGRFQFSPDEVNALTDTNQVKLDSIKRFHRKACSGVVVKPASN